MVNPVIRTIDIETAPNLAHVWSFFKANVGLNQVMGDDFIMSYAYKDLGCEDITYVDCRDCYRLNSVVDKRSYRTFIKGLRDALEEADIVIAHNGNKFDIPWINGQCALQNIKPPSPFRSIDTLIECRKSFRFPSYRLEYLVKRFGLHQKLKHKKFPGHDLWAECLYGNAEAWDEMALYNVNDVAILEELYLKIRPWIKNHPNVGAYSDSAETVCPVCGSNHIHYRGYYYTNLSKFHKFQCQDCGKWGRDRVNLIEKSKRQTLSTNAL